MDEITVDAQVRIALGKKTKALRRSGITPFHVYGPTIESASLQADTATLVKALNDAGYTSPLTVKVGKDSHFVMVQTIQKHPVTERLLHVDMMEISRTQRVHAAVPLRFEGESMAAREEGAQVVEDLHEVELEALALEMPHELMVDISSLTADDPAIHAGDLTLPSGVTLVTDPEVVIARFAHRRVEEEEEEEAVEEEAAEGEETPAEAAAEDGEGGKEEE